jgi:hypothetical protein
MKAIYYVVAVVASLAFTAAVGLANPAMMKKDRPGYPSEGSKVTNFFGSAAIESAVANETLGGALTNQNKTISEGDQLKRSEDSRLPAVKDPGYVNKGVTEGHIKDATKASPNP